MLALLLACSTSSTIGGDTGAPDDTSAAADTAETAEPPVDMDADGYPAGEDCMDLNDDVHPGATELWNGLDDDCDGVTDAEGDWQGTVDVDATAVYEGHPYSFTLSCPIAGTLAGRSFSFTVTCTSNADNAREVLLLGDTFTLTPKDPTLNDDDTWSGKVVMESSAGWDTTADGSVTWSDLDHAAFEASLSAASLALTTSGPLTRMASD